MSETSTRSVTTASLTLVSRRWVVLLLMVFASSAPLEADAAASALEAHSIESVAATSQHEARSIESVAAWDIGSDSPAHDLLAASQPASSAANQPANPAANPGASIIGQIGGSSYAVALEGDTLYLGVGSRIVILDVSADGDPRVLGRSPSLQSVPLQLAVENRFVFAASRAGLSVIDARDPATAWTAVHWASREGTIAHGWSRPEPRLALSDGHVFYAPTQYEPVQVLDVSDPTRPEVVATLHTAEPPPPLDGLAVEDGRAYLAYSGDDHRATNGAVAIYDVMNPRRPALLGLGTLGPYSVSDIAVSDRFVLLAGGPCGLEVLDASNPSEAETVGCATWGSSGYASRVANHGRTALVLDSDRDSMWVVDWPSPASPQLSGWMPVAAEDAAIGPSGNRWFVADRDAGLRSFEVASLAETSSHDVATLEGIDRARRPSGGYHVAAIGDRLLVGVSGGVHVFREADSGDVIHETDIPVEVTSGPVALTDDIVLLPRYGEVHAYAIADDLGDSGQPRLLSTYEAAGSVAASVVVGDLVVFGGAIGYPSGFVEVVDYSAPGAPRRLSMNNLFGTAVHAVANEGNLLYVARRNGWLDLISIDDPADLRFVSTYASANFGFDSLVVRDGYIYSSRSDRLTILDARDPAAIRETYTGNSFAGRSARPGDLTFLGDLLVMPWRQAGLGIWLLDVSDPSSPRHAGVFGSGGVIPGVTVWRGNVCYLLDEDELWSESPPLLLREQMVTSTMDVRRVGRHSSAGFAESVAFDGDLAFVAGSPEGLNIVDVADPAQPRLLGSVALPSGADNVAVGGGYAYVTSPWRWALEDGDEITVHVIDVTDPNRPVVAGSLTSHGYVEDLTVSRGRLYVARPAGLTIYDIAIDPTSPLELGHLRSRGAERGRSGSITHVAVDGPLAVIADAVYGDPAEGGKPDELRVVDVSDPSSPEVLGGVSLGEANPWSHIRGLDIAGGRAYALAPPGFGADEVFVADVSSPGAPILLGMWRSSGDMFGTSLAAAGDVALVGSWYGIAVLDVSGDGDPQEVAQIVTPGLSRAAADIAADDDGRVFFANGLAGLILARVSAELLPTPTAGPFPTSRPLPSAAPTETAGPTVPPTTTRRTPPTMSARETPTPSPTPNATGPAFQLYAPAAAKGPSQ